MPVVCRALVTMNPSGPSKDLFTNTWHILVADPVNRLTSAQSFTNALNVFYQAIDVNMSALVNAQQPALKWYDLSEPEDRVPFYEQSIATLAASASSVGLPEMALCLSYHGLYVSGQPSRRRRGRIYLGPWAAALVDTTTGKATSAVVSSVVAAAQVLLDTSQAATDWKWCVYSRTSDSGQTGTTGAFEVTTASVDNNIDIVRRRGSSSATRTVVT